MSAVRTSTRVALGLMAGLLLLAFAAPTADAQQDPYGSTTTTSSPRIVEATLSLQPVEGRVGDTVVATVGGVFFGESVDILFDGVVVGRTKAPGVFAQSAGAPVQFNGAALAAQSDDISTTVKVTFSVPNAKAGAHRVAAVGDTFIVEKGFTVLDAKKDGGKLPRTGIYAALLVAIALALIVGGRAFIAASKVRRGTNAAFMLDEEDGELTHIGDR